MREFDTLMVNHDGIGVSGDHSIFKERIELMFEWADGNMKKTGSNDAESGAVEHCLLAAPRVEIRVNETDCIWHCIFPVHFQAPTFLLLLFLEHADEEAVQYKAGGVEEETQGRRFLRRQPVYLPWLLPLTP